MNAPGSQGRRFTPTRVIAIAIIAVLGVGLGWLRFAPETAPVSVPAGAHAGQLTIKPCTYATDDGSYAADCGTLVVPENRANPRSRLIAVPVIRIHARSATPAEPIFRFQGGPGLTNMSFPQASRFAGDHDVVLVGYRGVDGCRSSWAGRERERRGLTTHRSGPPAHPHLATGEGFNRGA
jgi:hypothetical protein